MLARPTAEKETTCRHGTHRPPFYTAATRNHVPPSDRHTPWAVVWLFALGWAVARADTVPRRLLMTAVAAASVVGFFGQPGRDALVIGGVALLARVATVRVPRVAGRIAGVLASSSLCTST